MSGNPDLAPPGAGLPALERWFARMLLLALRGFLSPATLSRWLQRESARVLALAATLPGPSASQPVLVPRLTGLEDSSRYWSVNMVLQHLVIVDHGIHDLARALSGNVPFDREVRIAEVKPGIDAGAEQADLLREAVDDYVGFIASLNDPNRSARHGHPWFGMLDLRGWHALAAMHTMAHRRQVEAILARLD